jgi:hypothetical protein
VTLLVLSPREASIFACVCDTVVAPEPALPPVSDTDAVAFFDRWLLVSPRLNRAGLRTLLYAAELAPPLLGFGRRLRGLAEADRALVLDRLEHAPKPQVRELVGLLKNIACLSYYGDDRVMLQLGYDAEANLRRAREVRSA